MRIGIDLSFIRPDHKNGGTEAVMKNLIKGFEELDANGLKTDIVYFIHRDIFKDYAEMFPNLNYKVYDSKLPHALRTVVFQTFRLHRLLVEERVDVLYFPTFQTGLRRRFKIPVVVNPHDIQYKYYPEYFSRFKRMYFQMFYGNALKKSDSIVAISQYVMKSYEQHFKKQVDGKIRLIYDPIDFSKREEVVVDTVKKHENRYILCINSLTKHKNLITLVKAYDLLIKRNKSYEQDYRLVIGGAAWNGANELADYIKEHDLEKHVILTGYLTDGQLTYLYNHARLFVTPSLYEGFGMTPIEAMAAGCPVISSKETSLYEVTKGFVRYYEPATDEKMLCEAMEKELQEAIPCEEKQRQLRKCKEAVLCYDKAHVAKQYLNLFYETAHVPYGETEEHTKLYGKLFEQAANQMDKAGLQLPCTKNGYVAAIGSGTRKIDVSSYLDLKEEEFVDAVWMACFQKMPDSATRERLQQKTKKEILETAAREGAFAVRGMRFVGNPYFQNKVSLKSKFFALAAGVKNSVLLRKIAKKMPKGLQNKIRKLFC